MILQLRSLAAVQPAKNPFALFQGMPVHPLVVHAAVVFIPLAALGLIAMAVVPKLGARYGWIDVGLAFIALGSAYIAKESGEAFQGIVGEPGYDHAQWGDQVPLFAGVLLLAALGLWLILRSYVKRDGGGKALVIVAGIVAAIVAVVNLYWVVQTGHTGAESVWKGDVSTSAAQAAPVAPVTAQPSASASATKAAKGSYTAAQVARHNSASDCWTSINGNVYDVTSWINQHPGGAQRIINLCGIDGSTAFDAQHGGQPRPEQILASFKVGTLG